MSIFILTILHLPFQVWAEGGIYLRSEQVADKPPKASMIWGDSSTSLSTISSLASTSCTHDPFKFIPIISSQTSEISFWSSCSMSFPSSTFCEISLATRGRSNGNSPNPSDPPFLLLGFDDRLVDDMNFKIKLFSQFETFSVVSELFLEEQDLRSRFESCRHQWYQSLVWVHPWSIPIGLLWSKFWDAMWLCL